MRPALAALLLPGCTCLYPFTDEEPPTDAGMDAAPDAPPADAGIDAEPDADAGGRCEWWAADLVDDLAITPQDPGNFYGEATIINIRRIREEEVDVTGVALLRFELAGLDFAGATAARVTLPYAEMADACGCDACECTACDGLERGGQLDLHVMRSDWNETDAAWNRRGREDGDLGWQVDGATGPLDRAGSPLASVEHVPAADAVFDLDRGDLDVIRADWLGFEPSSTAVSVQIVAQPNAQMIMSTQENALDPCSTDGAYGEPKLDIQICD